MRERTAFTCCTGSAVVAAWMSPWVAIVSGWTASGGAGHISWRHPPTSTCLLGPNFGYAWALVRRHVLRFRFILSFPRLLVPFPPSWRIPPLQIILLLYPGPFFNLVFSTKSLQFFGSNVAGLSPADAAAALSQQPRGAGSPPGAPSTLGARWPRGASVRSSHRSGARCPSSPNIA